VKTDQALNETTRNDGARLTDGLRAAASKCSEVSGASNKPMVPTAHDWLNEHPIDPMRRHIGQSLGRQKWRGS
jgi:hypothetical protein